MKKLLCLLICACLLLVGCGPKTPDTNEAGDTSSDTPNVGGADKQASPESRANNKHYTGIFIDAPNTDGEAHFWEDAKLKYLG